MSAKRITFVGSVLIVAFTSCKARTDANSSTEKSLASDGIQITMRVNGRGSSQTAEYVLCPAHKSVPFAQCQNPFLKNGQPVVYKMDSSRSSCRTLETELNNSCSIAQEGLQRTDKVGKEWLAACGFPTYEDGSELILGPFACACAGAIGAAMMGPIAGLTVAVGAGLCLSSLSHDMSPLDAHLALALAGEYKYIQEHMHDITDSTRVTQSSVRVKNIVTMLAAANKWTVNPKAKEMLNH